MPACSVSGNTDLTYRIADLYGEPIPDWISVLGTTVSATAPSPMEEAQLALTAESDIWSVSWVYINKSIFFTEVQVQQQQEPSLETT
jgi:hypothetical protein